MGHPRILIAAPASGSGKTTVTCGLLHLMRRHGLDPLACKCGPDYIDPMFHSKVIGTASRNLDLFFSDEQTLRALVCGDEKARSHDLTVIEGAMGFYDGIAVSSDASAWDVARITQTPVVLVVDGRGRARSIAAEVLGFQKLRNPSMIAGIIINRVNPMMFPRLAQVVQQECGLPCLGYVPMLTDCVLESRHLGLVTADEVADLRRKLDVVADAMEKGIDLDALLRVARSACDVPCEPELVQPATDCEPVIAVARDEAFCFYYDDALQLLERLGARLMPFSPLRDAALPEGVDGIYLGGGYPELHVAELSANASMLKSVAQAIEAGTPTVAECGGFLYLHTELQDADGASYPMVGVVKATGFPTGKLGRFGYVTLTAKHDGLLAAEGDFWPAHEFHYWDSTAPGDAFSAQKPQSKRGWECCVHTPTLYAGFPHGYFPGNVKAAARFVSAAGEHARARRERD